MGTFIGRKVQNIRRQAGSRVPSNGRCDQRPGRGFVPFEHAPRRRVHRESAGCVAGRGDHHRVRFAREQRAALAAFRRAARKPECATTTSIVLGPPTGYVVKFTNGLAAYLSGDTGIHTEMKTVVNEFHKANLAVLNLGPSAGTVMSSAYAMNELVRPASVILTHPNEAVTEGGKLRPASRTAALIKQLKPTAHLAISGRTMEFDGRGKCVAGC